MNRIGARHAAWGILAVAALARVVLVFLLGDFQPLTDGAHFDKLGAALASEGTFGETTVPAAEGPTAFRAPLYPALLGALYAIFGVHNFTAALLLNAVLGTISVGLVGVIARQLWNSRVGLVAMAIAAVHPAMIMVGSALALEPLLVTLSLGAVACTLRHRELPRSVVWPLAAGLLLGLAILTRESGFLYLPFLMWIIWRADRGRGRSAGRALAGPAALLVVAALVVVPWTIRNAIQFGEFIPVSTSSGVGLAGTYNETSMARADHPGQWIPPWTDPQMFELMAAHEGVSESEQDRLLRSAALQLMRENPGYPLRVGFHDTIRMFDLDGGTHSRTVIGRFVPYPAPLVRLAVLASYLTLAGAVLGMFTSATRRAPGALWLLPIALTVFSVIPLPGSIRYRSAIEPFLVLLTALAVASGLRLVQGRLSQAPARERPRWSPG